MNVPKYVPVLERNGWTRIRTLESGVQIWENPDAKLPQPSRPPQRNLASFSWGTLPILALVASLSLGSLRLWPAKAEQALRTVHDRRDTEKAYLLAALEATGGVGTRAAELLKMSYRSFKHCIKKYGI